MSVTFAVGDLTIHRVIESEAPLFDPLTFFPTLTSELLEENLSWLKPDYVDPASGQLMLCIQSYIVRTPHHNILIDSCVGNHKERPNYPFWNRITSDRYEKNLAATGLTVESYLDTDAYPSGIKVTDQEMDTLHLERDAFHGDWNYTLLPRVA